MSYHVIFVWRWWDAMMTHTTYDILFMYLYHMRWDWRREGGKKKDICLSTYHHFCIVFCEETKLTVLYYTQAKYQFRFMSVAGIPDLHAWNFFTNNLAHCAKIYAFKSKYFVFRHVEFVNIIKQNWLKFIQNYSMSSRPNISLQGY